MNRPVHVMMLGLRGFPGVQGGVETHAENLCSQLVERGCDVTVLVRSPYQPAETGPEWKGVKFVSLWTPKSKGLEAILHSFLGVLYAAVKRPDILHIQAIGPALMTLPARLLGLRVVVTHHGPDYDRQKWGQFARFILQLGERWGMRWSNGRIVISKVIADLIRGKHGMESALIPNGVVLPQLPDSIGALDKFGLNRGRYVLLVSRLVQEKRHLDLIAAFKRASLPDWKLVIVGGADHPDVYQREVLDKAAEAGAVMTGFQGGLALQELYAHAGLFVLPSSHEGLPIALLEALSYGLPVLASDIPANLEVCLPAEQYFPLGNIEALADRITLLSRERLNMAERESIRGWVTQRYDWQDIAEKTLGLYTSLLGENRP
ncbi:MAG: glycosyltransferase family 4 protein [Methylobacter sp.]|uniref:glycosyltransferase family 4 protein n=1 Tax=Methylobacter sp. TaxID=2051955 RepID=UPI002731BBF3|nr:glycosyltransferase family 4 protein [Methylobacter sp.]MDP1666740.1 glycosyltransferase family 4 protein [Methylobacter sp.]